MADNDKDRRAAEQAQGDRQKQEDAARKRVADQREASERQRVEKMNADAGIKPTPTQEENDQAAQGVHVLDKEPDGSPEQPPTIPPTEPPPEGAPVARRQVEAGRSGAPYQTRDATRAGTDRSPDRPATDKPNG
jgi:hypothetical protein